jgi:hypothetical protein
MDKVNSIPLNNPPNPAHRPPIEPAPTGDAANRETRHLGAISHLGVCVLRILKHTHNATMARVLKLYRKIQQNAFCAVESAATDQLKDLHGVR